MIDINAPEFWPDLIDVLWLGLLQTLYMVGGSLFWTILIGLPLGVLLVTTEKGGLLASPFGSRAFGAVVNRIIDFVVNLGRSVPFIILMIALIPFTRLLLGRFIGTDAAIVPLSAVAIPFFARMVEIALKEVDSGLVEAGESLGASKWQIIRKVLLPEAMPSIILGTSTTITSIINFSAMAGVVAAGGLGDVAIRYGYQRYSWPHIIAVIIVLFALVMLLQGLAALIARALAHRGPVRRITLGRLTDPRAAVPD
ncbi:methionine ABC transporter permease [Herbiconiux sp. L3-i23]|uniref:methionine ABC transporter permease n=1 Tax=Herbiconiux sp. L3-i23 TaxID=2905871 RepID=UPI00206654CF|nr:methionine ABC transporter permease [Herbiconiux sp. L3-i23]BDI22747.1 methionine ABC transporter permease [Herbiconiux sp. L3-i23]